MDEVDLLRSKLKDYEKIINLGMDLISTISEQDFLEKNAEYIELLEKHKLRKINVRDYSGLRNESTINS